MCVCFIIWDAPECVCVLLFVMHPNVCVYVLLFGMRHGWRVRLSHIEHSGELFCFALC